MSNTHSQKHYPNSNRFPLTIHTLITLFMIPILISCGSFYDEKENAAPEKPAEQSQQEPSKPQPKESPAIPKEPDVPKPKPGETKEQKYWRLCEAERLWAFNARIIDSNALRLFQNRNFAPVFKNPGVRQSGIEGWYACANALEENGFVDPHDL